MKTSNFDTTVFVLRLERGEQIAGTIRDFARDNGITNAAIQGIGSVEDPILAHYSIETRHFTEVQFEGIYEVTSLMGNIGLIAGEPVPHLHATISDIDMNTHGGHLKAGAASATLEVIITVFPSKLSKRRDETIGLDVWDIA